MPSQFCGMTDDAGVCIEAEMNSASQGARSDLILGGPLPSSIKTKCRVIQHVAAAAMDNAARGDERGVRAELLGLGLQLVLALAQVGEADLAREISASLRMASQMAASSSQEAEPK